jgi:hypothetical protein
MVWCAIGSNDLDIVATVRLADKGVVRHAWRGGRGPDGCSHPLAKISTMT